MTTGPFIMNASLLGSIPSPSDNGIEIGPLNLRAYGILIALGVIAAVWLLGRRLEQRGGDPEWASRVAVYAVPAGLVGARAYHVFTSWDRFSGNWGEAFEIWNGGLGIPGGVVGGVLGGLYVMRRDGIPVAAFFDAAAPALPLAQAIGRLGNWFNQELYGKPTDLPWGLEIDPENRVSGFEADETFHPTFLYEALWNVALVGFLLWLDRRGVLRPGRLFAVYVLGYATGRIWIEAIRIDTSEELLGVRWNVWLMGGLILGAIAFLVWSRLSAPAPAAPDSWAGGDSVEEIEASESGD
ncbi:MAG: prolipoprotein diacylglyceryl transferase [Acidimicrobiales bacterium]